MHLTKREKLSLAIQEAVSYCLFLIFGPLIFIIFKYKFKFQVDDLEAHRKKYQEILGQSRGPVLICTNHLTKIDSVIQAMIINSVGGYLLNFKSLPWNLPEKSNYYHKFMLRAFCYLGKCIPVQRMTGPHNKLKTMSRIQHVLSRGNVVSIFPEGTRSRSGLISTEDFSYGTGEILKKTDDATVICLYLRGRKNGGFANYPQAGERFYLKMESFAPVSEFSGLRRVKDISTQIIIKLKDMETEYFENEKLHWQ